MKKISKKKRELKNHFFFEMVRASANEYSPTAVLLGTFVCGSSYSCKYEGKNDQYCERDPYLIKRGSKNFCLFE